MKPAVALWVAMGSLFLGASFGASRIENPEKGMPTGNHCWFHAAFRCRRWPSAQTERHERLRGTCSDPIVSR
jgi:hypothetical protein